MAGRPQRREKEQKRAYLKSDVPVFKTTFGLPGGLPNLADAPIVAPQLLGPMPQYNEEICVKMALECMARG